jgi:hypothetical protein
LHMFLGVVVCWVFGENEALLHRFSFFFFVH